MTSYAITVLGHDRPGIIATATGALAELGLNLEDSSMTRLRGHFAMTLICGGEASIDAVRGALEPLGRDKTLTVTVFEVPEEPHVKDPAVAYVLSVHGSDRPGIVSALMSEIATSGGNVTDLTTRLADNLSLVVAEIELPTDADVPMLQSRLRAIGADLGVTATLRPVEADEF
jgi:glycine cleavage system transcriptional repressor